ncbi:hypothetical protein V3C99_009384, partial [Haemonchus contortus]
EADHSSCNHSFNCCVSQSAPDKEDENEETTTTAISTLAPDSEMTPVVAQQNTATTTTTTSPTTTSETSPSTSTKKPCVLVWICFGPIFHGGPIFSVPGPVVHVSSWVGPSLSIPVHPPIQPVGVPFRPFGIGGWGLLW